MYRRCQWQMKAVQTLIYGKPPGILPEVFKSMLEKILPSGIALQRPVMRSDPFRRIINFLRRGQRAQAEAQGTVRGFRRDAHGLQHRGNLLFPAGAGAARCADSRL